MNLNSKVTAIVITKVQWGQVTNPIIFVRKRAVTQKECDEIGPYIMIVTKIVIKICYTLYCVTRCVYMHNYHFSCHKMYTLMTRNFLAGGFQQGS